MRIFLSVLLALLLIFSVLTVGIVPAAAAYAAGQFTVDEVLEGGEHILTGVNGISFDANGYYEIVLDWTGRFYVTAPFGTSHVLFEAPAGYYIYYERYYNHFPTAEGYVCDRVDIKKTDNGYNELVIYLNGESIYSFREADNVVQRFYVPYLPTYAVDSKQNEFMSQSAVDITVYKLGEQSPQPSYVVPDQTLPRIMQVWQSVTNWVVSSLSSVTGVFYAAGQLTLLGCFAVIALCIALIFLLIAFVRRFLFLRG